MSLTWVIFGVFWCLTIVGIPIGLQCFKFAAFSLAPFGKDILLAHNSTSFILNLLWIIFGGLEIAVTCAVIGLLFCISIIGIPFGYQCFKLAKLALMPFGAEIIYSK
ncbi:MAG: hypothetical protein LBV08_05600 [Clostridiales bacterium]|nr:hypothetical protein [Clostridiales bacterium]